MRSRHDRVPDRRAFRDLGRRVPRPPPISRPQTEIRTNAPGLSWLTAQLTECARAAVRTKGTYFAAHYAQLRGRRGEPKAIGAIRHDLLVAYYHIVRDQVPYRDLGPDWQRKRYSHRTPRPPPPTPTRSARLHRHPRRQTDERENKPPELTTRPRSTADTPPARTILPKPGRKPGIHRSAFGTDVCRTGARAPR